MLYFSAQLFFFAAVRCTMRLNLATWQLVRKVSKQHYEQQASWCAPYHVTARRGRRRDLLHIVAVECATIASVL
jgi:hypothetical protein